MATTHNKIIKGVNQTRVSPVNVSPVEAALTLTGLTRNVQTDNVCGQQLQRSASSEMMSILFDADSQDREDEDSGDDSNNVGKNRRDDVSSNTDDVCTIRDNASSNIDDADTIRDDAGTIRDDVSSNVDDAGTIRDDISSNVDDAGTIRDDAGTIRDDASSNVGDADTIRDDASSNVDDAGTIRDDADTIRDNTSSTVDDAGTIRDDADTIHDNVSSNVDDADTIRDDTGTIRDNTDSNVDDVVEKCNEADTIRDKGPEGYSTPDMKTSRSIPATTSTEEPSSQDSMMVVPETTSTEEPSSQDIMVVPETPEDNADTDDELPVIPHDEFAIRMVKKTKVHFRLRRTTPTLWRHEATCFTAMRVFSAIDDGTKIATPGVEWKIGDDICTVLVVACLGYSKETSRSAKVVDSRATEIILRDVSHKTAAIKFSQMKKVRAITRIYTSEFTRTHTMHFAIMSHTHTQTLHR